MAERLRSRAFNQKVAGCIPGHAKGCCVLGQGTSPYLLRGECPCTNCKSLWIRASAKWLHVNVQCLVAWPRVQSLPANMETCWFLLSSKHEEHPHAPRAGSDPWLMDSLRKRSSKYTASFLWLSFLHTVHHPRCPALSTEAVSEKRHTSDLSSSVQTIVESLIIGGVYLTVFACSAAKLKHKQHTPHEQCFSIYSWILMTVESKTMFNNT